MKSWTQNCHVGRHPWCKRDTLIPKRLVDLGDDDQSICLIATTEDVRFNIIQGQDGAKKVPPYLALSYCWGRPHISRPLFKTETKNLESRMAGINLREVPRTIADAFLVTRALGHRFLWIDALYVS